MKKFVALTAVATVALAATPALAQAPQGPRVEALVGYDALRLDISDAVANGKFKDEGVLYGLGVGYDVALGNGVSLGADLEASDSTAKKNTFAGKISAGRDLYAGGRVSFPLGADGSNVYLKGGYTNARFTLAETVTRLTPVPTYTTYTDNVDGYRLGAGAQFALTGKSYVGGEYRYSNYEGDLVRHQVAATVGTRF
ncbi:outer membrane protein [Sphingomonas glaciei]|uniref:Porin family protein n=1 Tax=Sphingomonas glaciei TaxID=2938948 RepID=A0ABY5MYM4_9SPHN|nr:outer membrane beta-barrel protein [Sphingomonas glaciei]UUR08865.1 porin family protein [Sphingomonas glaciei]